jgi:septum formation protein
MSRHKLILASASPRRQELLRLLLPDFEVKPCTLPEPQCKPPRLPASSWVQAVAYFKARAVADDHPGRWVLGADTVVVCSRHLLGKPTDLRDARRMLRLQAGRNCEVLTAVSLVRMGQLPSRLFGLARTVVRMRADQAAIDAYLRSGDWQGKAGAYGIQDGPDRLIEHVAGSFSNVVGLPLEVLGPLLQEIGLLPPSTIVADGP